MLVRILSGNLRDQVVHMDRTEAEINLATGFVELVVEAPAPVEEEPKKPVMSRSWRGAKAEQDER